MNTSTYLVLAILIIPMFFVFKNRLRIDLAALLIAAFLSLCQYAGLAVLGPANTPENATKAISGFGQPVVLILISLFVLTSSLEKSGVTHWITKKVLALGGTSERKLVFYLSLATAFLSLFMNTVAAGALLIPTAIEAAKKTGIKPGKLLIPVSYGSLLGGMASYFTTANIITSNLLVIANPPQTALNLLSFAPVGGLIAIAGLAFLGLFGAKLLPARESATDQLPLQLTGDELQDSYEIVERTWELLVSDGSRLIGQSLNEIGFGDRFGLSVVAIIRDSGNIFSPLSDHTIQAKQTDQPVECKPLRLVNNFLNPSSLAKLTIIARNSSTDFIIREIQFNKIESRSTPPTLIKLEKHHILLCDFIIRLLHRNCLTIT